MESTGAFPGLCNATAACGMPRSPKKPVCHLPQPGQMYLLEEAGVIERYVAVLNAAKVGMGLAVFMRLAKGASNNCRKSSSAA